MRKGARETLSINDGERAAYPMDLVHGRRPNSIHQGCAIGGAAAGAIFAGPPGAEPVESRHPIAHHRGCLSGGLSV